MGFAESDEEHRRHSALVGREEIAAIKFSLRREQNRERNATAPFFFLKI